MVICVLRDKVEATTFDFSLWTSISDQLTLQLSDSDMQAE